MPNESLPSETLQPQACAAKGGAVAGFSIQAPPQVFHVLRETPCPYLKNRWERKIMTELKGPRAQATFSTLSWGGFRRSHQFAYRPACAGCSACVPVRILVAGFAPGKSLRRVGRRNADLSAEEQAPRATEEQYLLFSRYLASRHGDGEMIDMGFDDYRAMVEDSPVDTSLVEFRDGEGRLQAVCLTDWTHEGPSAVYSFFSPEAGARSLGTYCVLWLIQEARRRGLVFVYLGYWIAGSRKMSYKARFRPIEGLGARGWEPLISG